MTEACNSPELAIAYEGSYVLIETFHQGYGLKIYSGSLEISEFLGTEWGNIRATLLKLPLLEFAK